MKQVKGYIFLDYYGDTVFMMGKRVDTSLKTSYENLECNGLIPYQTKQEANKARKEFEKEREQKTKLASLEMEIAETKEELYQMEEKENLVTIMKVYEDFFKEDRIYGPAVEGKQNAYPLPGARIRNNGFKTFYNKGKRSAFDRAIDLLAEINRQGQSPATIATFNLEIFSLES